MAAVDGPAVMPAALREAAIAARGFMPTDEGDALWDAAIEAARSVPDAPFLEIGSYCGKSSVWLGGAAQATGTVLFALDHHRGSEENQAGWEWHEPDLVDPEVGRMDTLPRFRRTVFDAGLEGSGVPAVTQEEVFAFFEQNVETVRRVLHRALAAPLPAERVEAGPGL